MFHRLHFIHAASLYITSLLQINFDPNDYNTDTTIMPPKRFSLSLHHTLTSHESQSVRAAARLR